MNMKVVDDFPWCLAWLYGDGCHPVGCSSGVRGDSKHRWRRSKAWWPGPCRTATVASGEVVPGGVADGEGDMRPASCCREELVEALQIFRVRGRAAVMQAAGASPSTCARDYSERAEATLAAACNIVDAVLLGPQAHHPELRVSFRLEDPATSRNGRDEVVAIAVRFGAGPLVGEFATRSRMGVEMHLAPEVRFALRRPPSEIGEVPLVLSVDGLSFPALKDSTALRKVLVPLLGQDFTKASVLAWWAENKDLGFPLKQSKLRRVMESFLDNRVSMLPTWAKEKGLWAYVNAPTKEMAHIEAFEFRLQARGRITMTAPQKPPKVQEDPEHMTVCTATCREVLVKDRVMAERLAASSLNFLAMLHARSVDQPGADPQKIAKLLTAARHWGPARDGWQQLDETWLCVDQKDVFGRTIEEQGRVIWHLPASAADMPLPPPSPRKAEAPAALAGVADKAAGSSPRSLPWGARPMVAAAVVSSVVLAAAVTLWLLFATGDGECFS